MYEVGLNNFSGLPAFFISGRSVDTFRYRMLSLGRKGTVRDYLLKDLVLPYLIGTTPIAVIAQSVYRGSAVSDISIKAISHDRCYTRASVFRIAVTNGFSTTILTNQPLSQVETINAIKGINDSTIRKTVWSGIFNKCLLHEECETSFYDDRLNADKSESLAAVCWQDQLDRAEKTMKGL